MCTTACLPQRAQRYAEVRREWPNSEAGPSLHFFGIPSAVYRDLRGCTLDVMQVVRRQLYIISSDILLQAMQFRRAGDRNDPWLLGQQPRECDLRRRRVLPFCNLREQID